MVINRKAHSSLGAAVVLANSKPVIVNPSTSVEQSSQLQATSTSCLSANSNQSSRCCLTPS